MMHKTVQKQNKRLMKTNPINNSGWTQVHHNGKFPIH